VAISISKIKVGDVIVFDSVADMANIDGERLIVAKSQTQNKDDWIDGEPLEYITVVVVYQLTKDRKALISGTKLSFCETDTLLVRVRVIGHLNKLLNIPAERE